MLHRAPLILVVAAHLAAQQPQITWSDQEKPIVTQLGGLRKLPDDVRATTTKQLARQIQALPAAPNKLRLANGLASLSTEGDFGPGTLQSVADTLASTIRELPGDPQLDDAYTELASLIRYEHITTHLEAPQLTAALSKLEADDAARQQADFTLTDLNGKPWTLKALTGKVVLVNFWATWCPPCRKEMPDLDALYNQFKSDGLVILAISDEPLDKVQPFLASRNITYPILLDPSRKVNTLFHVEGIPKSFIYNRAGKLVSQSIDMRTKSQFLAMLAEAGLH